MTESPVTYKRFDLEQRIEHLVLLVSFTLLALTGLPQIWADTIIGGGIIYLLGGIELVRILHRISAVVLIILTIWHFLVVGYRVYVKRARWSMLPTLKDVKDAFQALGYNLGIASNPPQMGRYTFGEKVEYWAVIWGTVVMVFTGYLLWNPIAATNYLPGQAIPAALAAHGGEALLAVLAIIVWHIYHVHIKFFNRSMISGEISAHEMIEEHPLELEAIASGSHEQVLDPQKTRRRKMIYYPIAVAIGIISIITTYYFITFEDTAIDTVPRQTTEIVTPVSTALTLSE